MIFTELEKAWMDNNTELIESAAREKGQKFEELIRTSAQAHGYDFTRKLALALNYLLYSQGFVLQINSEFGAISLLNETGLKGVGLGIYIRTQDLPVEDYKEYFILRMGQSYPNLFREIRDLLRLIMNSVKVTKK